ncbi:hypothetical protein C4D60_Mb08t17910 [Musa balbisiana]|uniref:Uncharacterized protein n=1 Tax=Musa balbisiana TaxID=52838 RepID=A0A4S8K4J7_MUSBA|nr:hypothetical protein C4D60_Mb08t17910 [Musa balbisiana]
MRHRSGEASPARQTTVEAARNGFLHDGLFRCHHFPGFIKSAFPVTRKASTDLSHLPNNDDRVQCMKVWPIEGKKKFETLPYRPPLELEECKEYPDAFIRIIGFATTARFNASASLPTSLTGTKSGGRR